jgi:hypothetical protein
MKPIIQKAALTGICFLLSTLSAVAQEIDRQPIEVARLGPQVGERVPDFRLPDQHGTEHTLADIVGRNGAMLLFHRSADW